MLSNRLPEKIAKRLRLPLIAAPMLSVSGPELAIAACKAGVIGSFPLANARTVEGVDAWLTQIKNDLARDRRKSRPAPSTILPQSDHQTRANARRTAGAGEASSRDGHHQRRLAGRCDQTSARC